MITFSGPILPTWPYQEWSISASSSGWYAPAEEGSGEARGKQLFSNKASLWGIVYLQVVQQGLVGLGHRASQPLHFKRSHRVSGPPATTLQFTGLVKKANADPRGDFLLFDAKRASIQRSAFVSAS